MRKISFYIVLSIIFWGCKSIDKLEPAQTETFLKFYGETNTTVAKDLLVVDDGYIVLGTIGSTLNSGDSTTILFKTDLLGNKIWATQFTSFKGNSLTNVGDGYIIVGDSIDNTTTDLSQKSYMNLLKTDLEGNRVTSVSPPVLPNSHGIAAMFTSSDEVVAIGNEYSSGSASAVIVGYSSNLTAAWQSPRIFGVSNKDKVPYKSIFETGKGNIVWASITAGTSGDILVESTSVLPDHDGADAGAVLFNGNSINLTQGGFTKMPVGYAVAQTIQSGQNEKIGVSIFDQNVLDEYVLNENEFATGNYAPTAITNTPNGLLVAAITDQHLVSESTRSDTDLFIVEIGYDGKPKTGGIRNTFGGLGNEIPTRVYNASDGGYLILGTLTNTKGAAQIFILKINNKGNLN